MKKFLLTLLVLVTGISTYTRAQDMATISGTVYDQAIDDILPGAVVKVANTGNGARADMDGNFQLEIEPGTYELVFTFIGYEPVTQAVTVAAGEEVKLGKIKMGDIKEVELDEAVVQAKISRKTENAMLSVKKLSSNVIDGITSDNFRKIGDGDAAATIKRVPGVSINEGKYVYVRGLGDRYTKTTLNGVDIPGLDPDRNTLQLDIFPTSVMDNIIVKKSFTADLPADFTGGIVDIGLKDFPEAKKIQISGNLGYNPQFHFNNDYLYYKGSSTDFLGFDNGQRDIPATSNIPSFSDAISDPTGPQAQRFAEILSDFDPHMSALQKMSGLDFGFGASMGNFFQKSENRSSAYNVLVNYKNHTKFYQDAEYGQYGLLADPSETQMEMREQQVGDYGVSEALLSLMGGYTMNRAKSKYLFNVLHIQSGESKAGIFNFEKSNQGSDYVGFQHNLEYQQKSLTNLYLSGKYDFKPSNWELEWKAAPTLSRMKDPDIRFTRYVNRGGSPAIGTEGGLPQRIWRDLTEVDLNLKTDATKTTELFGREAKVKTGISYNFKNRDYVLRSFYINPRPGSRSIDLTGNPDELFFPENLWPNQENVTMGVIYQALFQPRNSNEYNANVNNIAAYGSLDAELTPKLKTIIGLRAENYVQRYTGENQVGDIVLDNDKVLDNLGLYPSLNLVYSATDKSNIRFSATRTVARPSMKELSYAEIYDPLTGRTFIGGLFQDVDYQTGKTYWDGQLVSTKINNFDLRYEIFPSVGNTFSVGAFYKHLQNPIEIVQSFKQAGAFQPRNVGDGQVLGAELEYRHDLGFISSSMKPWSINLNMTYTQSSIQYSETEKESREANKRTGQTIGDSREMAGQAPYMINGGISYDGRAGGNGLEAGLFYNVQGPTLMYVGIVDRPDIYSVPFHSLDFNLNKNFGIEDQYRVGFNVTNLLGAKRQEVFKSYQSDDQIFTSYYPGRLMKLSFAYTIR